MLRWLSEWWETVSILLDKEAMADLKESENE